MFVKIKNARWIKVLSVFLAVNILGLSSLSASNKVTLNAGTPIVLESMYSIVSNMTSAGQVVDFKVKYDIVSGDKVLIAAGSIAKGQVVRTQYAKGLGKAGFVEVQLNSVTAADGSMIPLAGGNLYREGRDRQGEAIILGVVLCLLFLTIKGENAVIPAGTQVNAVSAGTVFIGVE